MTKSCECFRASSQERAIQTKKIAARLKSTCNINRNSFPCRLECTRSEANVPLVEHRNRGSDVILPKVRLV